MSVPGIIGTYASRNIYPNVSGGVLHNHTVPPAWPAVLGATTLFLGPIMETMMKAWGAEAGPTLFSTNRTECLGSIPPLPGLKYRRLPSGLFITDNGELDFWHPSIAIAGCLRRLKAIWRLATPEDMANEQIRAEFNEALQPHIINMQTQKANQYVKHRIGCQYGSPIGIVIDNRTQPQLIGTGRIGVGVGGSSIGYDPAGRAPAVLRGQQVPMGNGMSWGSNTSPHPDSAQARLLEPEHKADCRTTDDSGAKLAEVGTE